MQNRRVCFYPHNKLLRELFEHISWLHSEIRDMEKFRRRFEVMREAGVKEVRVDQVLNHLKEQTPDWFANKSNEWLRSLYTYLNEQRPEWKEIKNLPLVRLEKWTACLCRQPASVLSTQMKPK